MKDFKLWEIYTWKTSLPIKIEVNWSQLRRTRSTHHATHGRVFFERSTHSTHGMKPGDGTTKLGSTEIPKTHRRTYDCSCSPLRPVIVTSPKLHKTQRGAQSSRFLTHDRVFDSWLPKYVLQEAYAQIMAKHIVVPLSATTWRTSQTYLVSTPDQI